VFVVRVDVEVVSSVVTVVVVNDVVVLVRVDVVVLVRVDVVVSKSRRWHPMCWFSQHQALLAFGQIFT
jgi:hypothetical protein